MLPNSGFIREMDNQSTLPYTTSSTHGDTGGVQKKTSLSSLLSPVVSPFLKLVHWSTLLSSIIISVVLAGIVAGTVARSYIRDRVVAYRRLTPNQNGVSDITSPSWALTNDVSQIALLGHSYHLDIDSQTLSIEWEVLGCGTYGIPPGLPGAVGEILEDVGCGILDRQVDVYFDGWVHI